MLHESVNMLGELSGGEESKSSQAWATRGVCSTATEDKLKIGKLIFCTFFKVLYGLSCLANKPFT